LSCWKKHGGAVNGAVDNFPAWRRIGRQHFLPTYPCTWVTQWSGCYMQDGGVRFLWGVRYPYISVHSEDTDRLPFRWITGETALSWGKAAEYEKTASLVCCYLLTLVPRSRSFLPWRWRRYVPPKCRFISRDLHGATSQKTAFFMIKIALNGWRL
jgi:hypothetical protein